MILYRGKKLDSTHTDEVITRMRKHIIRTLRQSTLTTRIVIEACNTLVERYYKDGYDGILQELLPTENYKEEQIHTALHSLKRENLIHKVQIELGKDYQVDKGIETINCTKFRMQVLPLGVLFHIAAGNIDVLPVYSVIEGLLVGNINILKLPSSDHGLSIWILSRLIEIEPMLADYIYVFDTPSYDIKSLTKLSELSDAVVVWGGDEAVRSVRHFTGVNQKIIEWGHKISFAYVTKEGMVENSLKDLARHMFETNQLLCSSCQGIYVDTDNMEDIYSFSERFLKIMEEEYRDYQFTINHWNTSSNNIVDGNREKSDSYNIIENNKYTTDIGRKGQLTLQLYYQELDGISSDKKVYRRNGCSIIASSERTLTSSYMYGNCWVKPLPRKNIISHLYPYRGQLQTVGLLCGDDEIDELSSILSRAGIVRIRGAHNMSDMIYGEAHDGEYPLRRYSRVVEYDYR